MQSRMAPAPVEITDYQTGCNHRLIPELTKLVLPPMPTPGLLASGSIGTLNALSQCLANEMSNRIPLGSALANLPLK